MTNASKDITLLLLDPIKHSPDFYEIYPDYSFDSNIEHMPFQSFYTQFIQAIKDDKAIVYAVFKHSYNGVIGFIVFEKLFPHILNSHIVIKKEFRNFYNAYKASLLAIDLVFNNDTQQIVAYIKNDNKNVRILLKKLGFTFWGKDENCMTYSLTNSRKI
ncbi:MAG: GNAT family N-acetyltransferase [Vampirovibrionia bacterium]